MYYQLWAREEGWKEGRKNIPHEYHPQEGKYMWLSKECSRLLLSLLEVTKTCKAKKEEKKKEEEKEQKEGKKKSRKKQKKKEKKSRERIKEKRIKRSKWIAKQS